VKAGWEVKALGDVCDVLDSKRKPITKRDRIEGPYPYYGATGVLGHVDGYLFDEPLVLLGEDGAKWGAGDNSAFSVEGKIWVNNHAHVLRPHRTELLDPWLIYFLNFSDLSEFISGMTVPKLNQGMMNSIPIPLPPLDEQKRIVEVLDAAFEGLTRARAHTETNLQNARELFERVSGGLLDAKLDGWSEKTLSQVCEKITDGTHQTPTYFENGVIFLSSKNVTSRKIDWENVKYIDEAQHLAMHKRIAPRKGDVLLAKNGTTGVAAIVDRDEVFDIYVSLAHLRPLECVAPEFLLYFMNSSVAKTQFNSRLKGQGVPNLHLKEIREVRILFPNSLSEQLRIVSAIKEVDAQTEALQSHYRAKLADLDALRQALLLKAFAGKLS
jgi:type I restriction enzyme S subunit